MHELGIMVLNMEQEKEYFNTLGANAYKYGFELYLFTPDTIDFTTNLVHGKQYVSNTFQHATFPLPTFIYDRCFYPSSRIRMHFLPIIQTLKHNKNLQFLGHGLPGKLAVYHALKKETALQNFLPLTIELSSSEQLVQFLKANHIIIIKPILGSQGKGVYKIQLSDKHVEINTNVKQIHYENLHQFKSWASIFTQHKRYLIQPYLTLESEKKPFDVRILLQKDETGGWIEQGRGIRVGNALLVSNLHAGGHIVDYTKWINNNFSDKQMRINQTIQQIIEVVPDVLEKAFHPLFELGIDLGIDHSGNIWILEVNSKPGHQVLEFLNNHKMYEAPFLYCLFLLSINTM